MVEGFAFNMRLGEKLNGVIRVAVVDSDPLIAETLRTGLVELGSFVLVAVCTTGKEVLELLPALPLDKRPHLVLLEIRLPELDGYAVCRALRERYPGMLTAFHTSHRLPCFINGARHAGADAYFCKPLPIRQLAEGLQILHRSTSCILVDQQALLGGVTGNLALNCEPRLSPRMEMVLELEAQRWSVKQMANRLQSGPSAIYTLKQEALRRIEAACQPVLTR